MYRHITYIYMNHMPIKSFSKEGQQKHPYGDRLGFSVAVPGLFASDLPGHLLRPSGSGAGSGAAQCETHGQRAGGAFWILETWADHCAGWVNWWNLHILPSGYLT